MKKIGFALVLLALISACSAQKPTTAKADDQTKKDKTPSVEAEAAGQTKQTNSVRYDR